MSLELECKLNKYATLKNVRIEHIFRSLATKITDSDSLMTITDNKKHDTYFEYLSSLCMYAYMYTYKTQLCVL